MNGAVKGKEVKRIQFMLNCMNLTRVKAIIIIIIEKNRMAAMEKRPPS